MKSKLRLLSFLMLFTFTANYAQSSAEQAGIAVQGIARDTNNTAIMNSDVNLTFKLYYNNDSDVSVILYTNTVRVETDAFGVFSHVIENPSTKNSKFANYQVWLEIKEGSTLISNEKLNHVPYAISANNGVPTGSIMPFMGAVAPAGWALCNGDALPSDATKLRAMVGANAPNLGGMFLRGAGANTNAGYEANGGPDLKSTQKDDFKSHKHWAGDITSADPKQNNLLKMDAAGGHTHQSNHVQGNTDAVAHLGGHFFGGGVAGVDKATSTYTTSANGAHTHKLTGFTDAAGGSSETRPVNYGVNYIIKL
jgi:microcystin-dependent protein